MTVPCNRRHDLIMRLFSAGPRNDEEIAILDQHIAVVSQQIQDAWSDKERETRAKRACSPVREPAVIPVISDSYINP